MKPYRVQGGSYSMTSLIPEFLAQYPDSVILQYCPSRAVRIDWKTLWEGLDLLGAPVPDTEGLDRCVYLDSDSDSRGSILLLMRCGESEEEYELEEYQCTVRKGSELAQLIP